MEDKLKQIRKKRAKNGERTSKLMSFRADDLTLQILAKVQNKGRLINDLVKQWWRHHPATTIDEDEALEELEDTFT